MGHGGRRGYDYDDDDDDDDIIICLVYIRCFIYTLRCTMVIRSGP